MVEYHDKVIGRIVSKLDELNLREYNHYSMPETMEQHGIVSKIGDKEIIGGKGLTSDTGTHVPLI